MKKILIFVLALMLIMSISSFASADGASLGKIPQSPVDIKVDAVKDDIYDQGLFIPLLRQLTPESADYGTKGESWSLFKDGVLYVFVHVQDNAIITPDPAKQENNPWETESVEIFINKDNSSDNANTLQYRIDISGWPCVYTQTGRADYGPANVKDAFKYAAKLGTNEYWVEFGIPVEGGTNAGYKFGYQFQINDINDGGQTWKMSPSSLSSSSWTAELYDYAEVGEMLAIEEETVEEAAAPVDAGAAAAPVVSTAPQTSDYTFVLCTASLIALLGTALIVKKVRG